MLVGLVAGTLFPLGSSRVTTVPWSCVACTADGGADFAANVVAFVPLGLLLVREGVSPVRAVGAGAALSAVLEVLQWLGIPGRTATLGDLLANTLGAMIGAAAASNAVPLLHPTHPAAIRFAALTAAVWGGTMTGSAWLLGREELAGPWPPRPDPTLTVPGYGWFRGRVARLTLDGWTGGRPDSGPLIAIAAVGARLRARVDLVGGDGRAEFVPAVAVLDQSRRPAVLVGQRGTAAEVRVATRARRWRLREPAFVMRGALAGVAVHGPASRARLDLALEADRGRFTVRTDIGASAAYHTATWQSGPALGWALVTPATRAGGPERHLFDALWVGALLLPFGYWLRIACTSQPGGRKGPRVTACLTAGLTVATGLGAGPLAVGASAGAPAAWLTAGGTIALGWWLERRATAHGPPARGLSRPTPGGPPTTRRASPPHPRLPRPSAPASLRA